MHSKQTVTNEQAREIGEIASRERRRMGLPQGELALVAGVSTRVVHQVEAGKATSRLDSVVAVLDALGLRLRVDGARTASSTDR